MLGERDNRRLGDFDRAKAIFAKLTNEPDFKDNEVYMSIIALQLRLIEAGDTASHKVPRADQPEHDHKTQRP